MRRTVRTGLLLLLVALAVAGGCRRSGKGAAFGAGLPKVEADPKIHAAEHAMYERLNRDRAKRGLPALKYDERLADIGRFHSKDMRDRHFFSHDSPTTGSLQDRLDAAGYRSVTARENLAEGPDVDTAQDGLLESPGHHANIMAGDITHVGIGIVQGGVEQTGNLTITQVFATPALEQSADSARASVLNAIAAARRSAGAAPIRPSPRLDALARKYFDSMDHTEASLREAGKAISRELSESPVPGVSGVVVGGQIVPDARAFAVPSQLASPQTRHFGVAVGDGRDPDGRPALKILVIVGM